MTSNVKVPSAAARAYDIPADFDSHYSSMCSELKTVFSEVGENKDISGADRLLKDFTDLYQSFSSEKQLFDTLNAYQFSDDPIYEHTINVSLLSRMLGELDHFDEDDLNVLTVGALFHDIGKTRIDPAIMGKRGKLTPHEFNIIKRHTKIGYQMLHGLFPDQRIAVCALMHHERCDGSGYPMGTTGKDINKFCRIIAICDVYAGMIARREYREPRCPFEIIRLFERDGLHKYDPNYTILFLRAMLDTYVGYQVRLNTGETGIISSINPLNLSRPTVIINGQSVNLAMDKKREILRCILS